MTTGYRIMTRFLYFVFIPVLYQDPFTILQKKNSKDNFLLNNRFYLEYLEILNQIDLVLTTSIQWVGFLERECSYVNLGFHENITELLPLFRFLSVPSSVVQSKSFVTVLRYIRTIFSGELLDLVTLSHCILILNPSVASCIGKPNGYNLSKPSIYQAQF